MLSQVTDIHSSIWINASAGCGKTTLLVKRLISLLVQKQKNIICITFTKTAANEMQNRLFSLLVKLSAMEEGQIACYLAENLDYAGNVDAVYVKNLLYIVEKCVKISTFHSFCMKLLEESDLFYQDISIQEEADKDLFQIIIDDFLQTKCTLPKSISEIITEDKLLEVFFHLFENNHLDYNEVIKKIEDNFNDKISTKTVEILKCFLQLIKKYKEASQNNITYGAIIDDFIEKKTWNSFEVLSKIDHILVDEAQDTNLKQWYIIAKLCEDFFIQENLNKTIFVVGDNKQSIYGFQGADPNIFNAFYYVLKSRDAANKLVAIDVQKSYRSAKPILEFVDNTFEKISIGQGEKITHVTHRINCPGYIEISPLIKGDEDQDKNFELAVSIAAQIKNWILSKRIIPAKKRAIKPCDIAVLVAHRTSFINYLHMQLQKENIEVNFIGKIKIDDNDILKLLRDIGRFVAYKYDEIAIIAILKSPIFAISDKDILNIKIKNVAINLYDHIKSTEIGQKISSWLNYCGTTFHVYTKILTKDIYESLTEFYGEELDYYLDIFLDNTLKEKNFYKFLDRIIKNDATLKITSGTSTGITISTVHGSKGMQYPVVFVADSNYAPRYQDVLLYNSDNLPFWYSGVESEYFEKIKEERKQATYREYLRLLYVALTRAEDEIYITGTGNLKKGSWYDICQKSLKEIGKPRENDVYFYTNKEYYFYCEEIVHDNTKAIPISDIQKIDLPCDKIKTIANLDAKRGELIHKILEYIFDIEDKEEWLTEFLKNFGLEFSKAEREEIFHSVMDFVKTKKEVKGESEVEILFSGKLLRVDKLYITEKTVSILDYKTSRDRTINHEISIQLELYKRALSQIYPQKKINTDVEWV